jgi:hypothetical protein
MNYAFCIEKELTSFLLAIFEISVSKASISSIHNSTTHGSTTISLINQTDCFHSTFTGFNTKFNCHSLFLQDADDKVKKSSLAKQVGTHRPLNDNR